MSSIDNRSDKPDIDRMDPDSLRASRRSAILSGLGKGSAALAAMSPLASQASRSHVLFNPLQNRNCYCTVSGFHSAALSPSTGANPPTCAAYLPRSFLRMPVTKIVYASVVSPLPVTGDKLRNYLKTLPGVSSFSSGVNAKLLAITPTPLLVPANGAGKLDTVFLPIDRTSCYFLQARNFPAGISGTGTFKSIFTNSTDARTLLQVLFEGVTTPDGGASNTPPSANCYFLSSYLSIGNSNVSPTLPVELDRDYVVDHYSDGNAALAADGGLFFSKLCTQSV